MSVDIGIIGLPKSGKTSIFNALTAGNVSTTSLAPNIGIAKVPDPRLQVLSDMFKPKKTTPAEVRYIDIGASVTGAAKSLAISGSLLNEISKMDTIMAVVRSFKDESVPHPTGSVDTARDIANIDMELTFSDLAIIEKRLERIGDNMKSAKPAERPVLVKEQELMGRLKAQLEKEVPIRAQGLQPEELRGLSHYQFLSAKPLLIVVNIGEEQLAQAEALEKELNDKFGGLHRRLITLCGKLEAELAQLDEAEAVTFRADMGIKESGLGRVVRVSFELLGLISFFTVGPDECKAWPIPTGTTAVKAAGKIHSDLERGFIRAEVISYEDLIKAGSLAEARRKGVLRLEGKNYVVQNGDIMTILFNV